MIQCFHIMTRVSSEPELEMMSVSTRVRTQPSCVSTPSSAICVAKSAELVVVRITTDVQRVDVPTNMAIPLALRPFLKCEELIAKIDEGRVLAAVFTMPSGATTALSVARVLGRNYWSAPIGWPDSNVSLAQVSTVA